MIRYWGRHHPVNSSAHLDCSMLPRGWSCCGVQPSIGEEGIFMIRPTDKALAKTFDVFAVLRLPEDGRFKLIYLKKWSLHCCPSTELQSLLRESPATVAPWQLGCITTGTVGVRKKDFCWYLGVWSVWGSLTFCKYGSPNGPSFYMNIYCWTT